MVEIKQYLPKHSELDQSKWQYLHGRYDNKEDWVELVLQSVIVEEVIGGGGKNHHEADALKYFCPCYYIFYSDRCGMDLFLHFL